MPLELVSIGVSDYRNAKYSRLPNAASDAARIHACFGTTLPKGKRFHSKLLTNPLASEAAEYLEEVLSRLDDDSVFMFYFAGHALQERGSRRQWLLCSNALGCFAEGEEGTGAISSGYINSLRRRGKGRMFFCVDACRVEPVLGRGDSGLMGMSDFGDPCRDASATASASSDRQYAAACWTLLSCGANRQASDNGAFAEALVDTVKDLVSADREVFLGDAFVAEVTRRLQKSNPRQKPEPSGTPFVLVPGTSKPVVEPRVERQEAPKPEKKRVEPPQPPVSPAKTPRQLTTEANAALKAGRYDEAERLASEALRIDPSFGWAQFVLTEAQEETKKQREEEERRQAEERRREEEKRRRNLELDQTLNEGWLSFNAGDFESALDKSNVVLNERPTDEEANELKRLAEEAFRPKILTLWGESASRKAGFRQTLKIGNAEYGFCWIPAGEFEMGSPTSEKDRYKDETLHHGKRTRGFWLLETPTSQALYKEVMGENPSKHKGDNLPVEKDSWNDAMKFCVDLTKRLPKGMKASLPTEAQWEYACRAGTKTAYWYGDSPDSSKMNYACNVGETTPVKKYPANPWGLYDMHGNVCEWALDYFGDYPTRTVTDPKGPNTASYRVGRGGGWDDDARFCRSAFRYWYDADYRNANLGFRVLLSCD